MVEAVEEAAFGKPCGGCSVVFGVQPWRCGIGALKLGQGQAAAFCSLAQRPLTQRRGDTLGRGSQSGSIALTAMPTGVFGRRARVAVSEEQR